MGFPEGSLGKKSACKVGDLGSNPGLGRTLEQGNTHSSILAWRIPGTVKSMGLQRVRQERDFQFHFIDNMALKC